MSTVVAPLTAEHAEQVLAIYQAGIDEGDATFETSPPSWEAFEAAKLAEHDRFLNSCLPLPPCPQSRACAA